MQPIDYRDFVASAEVRREAWRRRFDGGDRLVGAKPNAGHTAIARLVSRGTVGSVITQNVDGLHQASGIPESQIIEIHGNASYAKCLSCGKRHELETIRAVFERKGDPPGCSACGGILKSATISFGQAMPEAEMEQARVETLSCDLFLAIGSSLVVYPAAGFPLLAKRAGRGSSSSTGSRPSRTGPPISSSTPRSDPRFPPWFQSINGFGLRVHCGFAQNPLSTRSLPKSPMEMWHGTVYAPG